MKDNSQTNRGNDMGFEGDCGVELIRGLSNLYSPQATELAHVRDVADVLLEAGTISAQQLEQLRRQEGERKNNDIEQLILSAKFAEADDILVAKAGLYGFQFRRIQVADVNRGIFEKFELEYIRANHIMPVAMEGADLIVATSEPANVFVIDDVKRRAGTNVQVVVCSADDIEAVCNEFDESSLNYDFDEIMSDMDIEVVKDEEEDTEDLEKSAVQSPVIKFVNYLLSDTVRNGASDIHIEPKEGYTKIRYRIDGVLFESRQAPAKMHPAIVSRFKIMSNLDISERRVPQDGKIAVIMGGRGIDLRISVLPTSHGEKVVVRVLDSKSIMRGLDESGMEPEVLSAFEGQVVLPNGILLVTGPTGSGKSTTLYSALSQMDGEKMNISTVEDPVEYDLESCNQVQVNERAGMTFAAALRSLLRQDPDIIMIGEIRDNETARIAVQAALTGHLVLSTLHTNDAPSSISRLVNIGIEPYLIAASLNGVLAQRLVRRICPECKEVYKAPPDVIKSYIKSTGIDARKLKLMRGAGCDKCRGSGYSGRAGIFELLVVNDNFRDIINRDSSVWAMRKAFAESGQPGLFNDGMKKVEQGITTIDEVLRVTHVCGQNEDENIAKNVPVDEQKQTKQAGSGKV